VKKQRFNSQLILRIIGTVLSLGLLALLVYEEKWAEIVNAVRQVPPTAIVVSVILMIFSRFFVVTRWYVLLRSGGVQISYPRAVSLTFTGLFANNFLPTTVGGDVVRLTGAMQMGYDRAICLASIAADRLVGMAGMIITLPFGLFALLQWGASPSLVTGMTLMGLWERAVDLVKRVLQTFSLWLKQPLALLLSFACTWGHISCAIGIVTILLNSMGEHVTLWLLAGLWGLAYFVTLIPISINGYGVQELTLTFLFTQVGGVAVSHSLVFAVLSRLLFMVVSLPGAIFLPSVLDETIKLGRNGDDAIN
jgi:uncharacterized membrane protein YbhN (UPF0104 family)